MDQKIGLGEAFMYADWDAKPSAKHFLTLLIRAKCYKSSLTKKMVITSQNESNVERKEAETGEPMAFSSSWKNLVEFAFGIGIIAKKLLLNLQKLMLNSIRNVVWLWNYAKHRLRENTMLGSAKNIHEHYDLGNELFEMFLDSSFTYSCALFDPIPSNELIKSDFALLETAQRRKYDKILTEMQLKSDDHVLEIGCGWGSCGLYAVEKYGCKWTGITISKEQLKIAQKKVEDAKLGDRIEYKLLDYRLEKGVYDKVLAIEMIEAVGHEYLPEFFRTLSDRLRPGGLACLQAITCPDAYYDRYRRSSDFIKKYIFPGGHLPSEGAIKAALPVQLTIRSVSHIGKHYSKTLDLWHAAWMEREKDILKMGYSKEFHRKWQFYFVLCSALFEYDHIDTVQMCITRH
uniref:Probable fatty acid methyltransferase n=1 Tax=Anisakis pegreffii TaxID=303229 RepID=A0A3G6JBC7_9BILA|nr:probable fatty acid methyltransferase [Anisakis pegreffii]